MKLSEKIRNEWLGFRWLTTKQALELALEVAQLEAGNEALKNAVADLYKQRMGMSSTIKLETGLLAHDIYNALIADTKEQSNVR